MLKILLHEVREDLLDTWTGNYDDGDPRPESASCHPAASGGTDAMFPSGAQLSKHPATNYNMDYMDIVC